VVHQAPHKELAGRFGNWIIRLLAVPGVSDTQAGFKILTRECVERVFPRLTVDRWGFDIEILAVARFLGFRIRELPITWINSSASKVGAGSYFEVMAEVWRVRRNLKSGLYR
jgi:dolichyl-phosphate beta-glucosyltransferase